MSATRRAGGARRDHDAYATPEWVARLVVPLVPELDDPAAVVLDPAAGDGALLAGLGDVRAQRVGFEIRPEACDACRGRGFSCGVADALTIPWAPVSAVVMNPPYTLARAFVEHALRETRRGGTVAALLRLAFLEGQARGAWLRGNAPDVYVLSKRPSFTGRGTDSTAYAWFVWRAGVTRTAGRLEVLAC